MSTTNQFLDVAWILVCAALVMLMQAGFSCLESGSVRTKNSINVAAKNFTDFCVSSAVFWLFGFALMFGATSSGFFGTSGFLFDDTANPWLMAFFIFQLGFCGTAVTIISGAVAERMRFAGYLVVTVIVSALIYPLVGHWVWGSAAGATPGGWLEQMGFIDFAGSTVVHSVGGWMSLAAIIIIGPRIGRFGKDSVPIHGHDLPMVTLGVFLLWFGWFGFNGGSTLGLTAAVPTIIVNTTISGAFGGLVAMALVWWFGGRPDVSIIMNGSLAGLVGITASAHIMTPLAAVGIGSIAAAIMCGVTRLLERLEIDDVVGAVPVHLAAGIWGTLAVAIFGDPASWGTGLGRWDQFGVQATGVGACFAWAFGVGYTLLWLINRWFPLRIDPEGERVGLNVADHGASTEILDLLTDMDRQRQSGDFSQHVGVEPHTEVGQIAGQYNRILDEINAESARREAASEALRQKTESLQLLQNAAIAANQAKTVEDAVQACLDDICAFGGWPVGHCYMVDDDTGNLISAKIWHLDNPEAFKAFRDVTEAHQLTPGPGLAGRTLATRKPTWIVDVTKDATFRRAKLAKDIEVKGGAAFPVLVGEDIVAVLEFFSPRPEEPNQAVLDVMASVGTQLGRVVERRRSEAALFQSVVDNMPAHVHLRDQSGRYILVNREYEDFYGVTNRLIRGKTLQEANVDTEVDLAVEENALHDHKVIETNSALELEFTIMRKGKLHTLADVKFPVRDHAGEIIAIGGIEVDITDRKHAEDALQEAYGIIKNQKERMEDELNIGREIQMSMIPLKFPPFPDRDEFSIYATLEPAREVGGDFYDYYFLDEERFCFCIGDVSGKGVPAALFMAMTKTLIKSRADDDRSTASILTHVNDELSVDNKRCMFVTIFAGIMNVKTGELLYTNAGHNPPYLRRRHGALEPLDKRHGPVIGVVEGMVYKEDTDRLEPGDLLFLYTDGVTEAMDIERHLFSDDRLMDLLTSLDTNDADSAVDNTVSAVRAFEGEAEQADDITVLGLRFHGTPEDALMAERRITIKNRMPEIAAVIETFEAFAEEFSIPATIAMKFNIIFDDLLNNIVTYAYSDDDEHDIEVRMELAGKRLTVVVTDDGVPFNPLSAEAPELDAPLAEREIGGLGIHLVRNLIDDVTYHRRIGKNVMTLMKHLEQEGRVS